MRCVAQIKLLVDNNAQAALLHAFDGKPSYALQGAQHGHYFSVPPSIVRSPQKQKVRAVTAQHQHNISTACQQWSEYQYLPNRYCCSHCCQAWQAPHATVQPSVLQVSVRPWCLLMCACSQMVAALPMDSLVLETDAPALGPDKDAPNVPANIVISAQGIARIKGVPFEQVVQITTENARKLFSRLKA